MLSVFCGKFCPIVIRYSLDGWLQNKEGQCRIIQWQISSQQPHTILMDIHGAQTSLKDN
jgi:hypothetical protein